MAKLPLNAFENLALNEIQHIVDVMREADVEENEDIPNDSTIKRAPKSKFRKFKKKESQQPVTENYIDTNNNTLKRNNDSENPSQSSYDNNTLQTKQDSSTISSTSSGIPSVPRVHMGAGFMKIFNQCPLEIYSSYCWVNNETKGEFYSSNF
jgi:E3 ubiquitin-protein ligase DOA10